MRYIYPAALAAAFLIVGTVAWSDGFFSNSATPQTPIAIPVVTGTTSPTTSTTDPGTYRLDQVALHNSAVSCWTAINGSVYDLTSFIPNHPGGNRILVVCGVDGTSAFEDQHSNTPEAKAELAKLKIGTLVQ